MKNFEFLSPATLAEATSALMEAGAKAKVLAGGTDLIVQLREGLREADVVIDVKHIPELTQLEVSASTGLKIGASVPCYKLYEHPEIIKHYGAIYDATRIIGGWQIQSRASVGGNLCNASPAADSIPALMVHAAIANTAGSQGKRAIPVKDFCTAPGKSVIQPGELLVNITAPAAGDKSGSAYLRFIPRNEMDIAVVGCGAWLRLSSDGKSIDEARIALGAVAPRPRMADDAAAYLKGKAPTEEHFAQAGELAKQVASPISDMRGTAEYRTHLVGVMVKRTLAAALARAKA